MLVEQNINGARWYPSHGLCRLQNRVPLLRSLYINKKKINKCIINDEMIFVVVMYGRVNLINILL